MPVLVTSRVVVMRMFGAKNARENRATSNIPQTESDLEVRRARCATLAETLPAEAESEGGSRRKNSMRFSELVLISISPADQLVLLVAVAEA